MQTRTDVIQLVDVNTVEESPEDTETLDIQNHHYVNVGEVRCKAIL